MNILEEIIDVESEYGKKYIELVSKPDTCAYTEVHHIVPVAYFRDVLGYKDCRTSSSADMDSKNLVKLSKGHHLLAHYYLMKCARKCIRTQMVNAFRCTYKTGSVSEITEADVLSRMKEIDRAYAKLKGGKVPHKDGFVGTITKTGTSVCEWKDGKKVGWYVKKDRRGEVVELGNFDTGFHIGIGYSERGTVRIEINEKTFCGTPSQFSTPFRFQGDGNYVIPYRNGWGDVFTAYGGTIYKRTPSEVSRIMDDPFKDFGLFDPFCLACLAHIPELLKTLCPKSGDHMLHNFMVDRHLRGLRDLNLEMPDFIIPQLPESCMEKYNKFVELGYLEVA